MIFITYLTAWLVTGMMATILALFAVAEDQRVKFKWNSYVSWIVTKGALVGPFAILPAFHIIRTIEEKYD